jgi:hypothetical protein
MTLAELEAKWPRSQFEQWKSAGLVPPDETYEAYLEMRREQEELARRQRREIFGGEEPVPYAEQPPVLTAEDEAILDRAWATVAAEKEEDESLSPSRVA